MRPSVRPGGEGGWGWRGRSGGAVRAVPALVPTPGPVSAGKLVRLRQKLSAATSAVRNLFSGGQGSGEVDEAVARLEALQVGPEGGLGEERGAGGAQDGPGPPGGRLPQRLSLSSPFLPQARMEDAKALFRNAATTEFVIVTIPTVMATAESCRRAGARRGRGRQRDGGSQQASRRPLPTRTRAPTPSPSLRRLAAALQAEGIPLRTIVVNQVVQANATDKFLAARRADQVGQPALHGHTAGTPHGRAPPLPAASRNNKHSPLLRSPASVAPPSPAFPPPRQARALEHLREDTGPDGLASLQLIEGPLCDLEVRGLPALQYFGGVVWK
jgi:arsenite-transporting ATPase